MSLVEKSNVYNQHQSHLKKKGNEALKKEYEAMGKKEKDLANIVFLMKKNQATLCQASKSVSTESSLKKREKWLTQKEVDAKRTEQEQHMHLVAENAPVLGAAGGIWILLMW